MKRFRFTRRPDPSELLLAAIRDSGSLTAEEYVDAIHDEYPYGGSAAEQAKRLDLPPPEGMSYEYGPDDLVHIPSSSGPLLNSRGEPAAFDERRLKLMKETLRNLQFDQPTEDHDTESPGRRIRRIQQDMAESNHMRCGNVVEQGIGHTANFVCLVYIGLGGEWDPPEP